MAGDAGLEVQAVAVVSHAATVDQVADQVARGRSAAAAVGLGRGAYGVLCQLIPALLDPVQEATIRALGETTQSLQRAADDLRATARDYTDSDRRAVEEFRGGLPR